MSTKGLPRGEVNLPRCEDSESAAAFLKASALGVNPWYGLFFEVSLPILVSSSNGSMLTELQCTRLSQQICSQKSILPTLCTVSWESMRLQRIATGNFEGVDRVHDSKPFADEEDISSSFNPKLDFITTAINRKSTMYRVHPKPEVT